MKKIWAVILILLCVFGYVNRKKLYVRDPFGSVSRNGSVEDGPQVFVSYLDDVLVVNDHLPSYLLIVQHGRPVGVPSPLSCLLTMLCLSAGYPVPQIAPLTGAPAEVMNKTQVQFTDENGREVVVKLR